MYKIFILVFIVLFQNDSLAWAKDFGQSEKALRRVALIIGSNGAPAGRKLLRFAYNDAKQVASVLRESGFSKNDLHVLQDPNPSAVLAKLDTVLAKLSKEEGESLFFFYYSGHADAQFLYPNGEALSLQDLRLRLDSPSVTVRIGVIDACRGGGWTGTKGLTETESFAVNVPLSLSNEGSVLISSSSGLEDAHESELLQGSFFTHHWNAGLRGAGDEDQDGKVTLIEAFAYAKALTIRDTAIHTGLPQHPSFQFNLSGRKELVLVRLNTNTSILSVEQDTGPIQLIHLGTGLIVLELPVGKRKMRLAVPPGRYMVRKQVKGKTVAREIQVKVNEVSLVREEELELVGNETLVTKGLALRPATMSTLAKGDWRLAVRLGISHGTSFDTGAGIQIDEGSTSDLTSGYEISKGITDRLEWIVPTLGFAYRGGKAGNSEWIPWGGLIGWGAGYSSVAGFLFKGVLGFGMDTRYWLSPRSSINFGTGVTSGFRYSESHWIKPKTLRAQATAGYTYNFGEAVTLNVGIGLSGNAVANGMPSDVDRDENRRNMKLSFGSIQTRALRRLPLVQIHLLQNYSIDGHAAISLDEDDIAETYMLGITRLW